MELIHYSAKPLLHIKSVEQFAEPSPYKPRGLWLSVEDGFGWKQWCERERFQLGNLKVVTKIRLLESAPVLKISTPSELDAFHKEFAIVNQSTTAGYERVDWKSVAKEWSGIIIAPYIHKRRLELSWYYGWDCSSGCIWDSSTIQPSFKKPLDNSTQMC